MLKKKSFYIIALVLGIFLLIIAFLLFLTKREDLKPITGVCFGIGWSLFFISFSNLLTKRMEKRNPDIHKHNEIEFYDERNTFIRNKAKAKAADFIQWCIMGIAYITIAISTHLWVTLVIVGVFVLYRVLVVFYISKYQKEI